MRRLLLLAVTTLVIAGCGSKDSATMTTGASTPTTTTTTAPPKKAEEPKGKLSAAEYKAARAAIKRTAKFKKGESVKRALRIIDAACGELTVQTELVQRLKSACVQQRRAVVAIGRLKTQKRECTVALNAGDVSCWSYVFRSIGRAARVSIVRERAINAEIRRRGLRGKCAEELRSSEKDLGNADAVVHDAISAANAAERRDGDAFLRATQRLQQDFDSGNDDTTPNEELRKLKTCV